MQNERSKIVTVDSSTQTENPPYVFPSEYKICYGHSKVGGRGVFATSDIKEGELIERCPMVPLENRSRYQHDPSIWRYCYTKPLCDCSECNNHGFVFYMVLGHGMIYNHQDDHNADWKFDYKNLYADVIANRNILKGNEVFVSYGSGYFKNREKVVVDQNAIHQQAQ